MTISSLPEYKIWAAIKTRCLNENATEYFRYGGRGITLCPEWKNSFSLFLQDMGMRPSKDYSIERIDNSRGYYPNNCKWATKIEQANNRRSNKLLTFNGKTQNMKQWSKELNISYVTLYQRLSKQKWSVERALTEVPIESKYITYQGKTRNIREWADHLGIAYGTLQIRLRRGMPVSKAFIAKDLRL